MKSYFRFSKRLRLPFFFKQMKILFALMVLVNLNQTAFSQCNNCPPGSTYNGGFFASNTNLSGSHACLAINGVYFVNEDVNITTSAIFLGPSAEILVSSGATLTLNDCEIRGCNEMWTQILVFDGGKLIADDVDFYDGKSAIASYKNTELTVKNCRFIDNHVGMHLRPSASSTSGQSGIAFSEPLYNNIFESAGNMLPPHAGEKGFAGIIVDRIAPLTIGEVGYPQNQFLDLDNGIIATDAIVTVENTLFQAPPIIDFFNGMTGIACEESEVYVSNSTFNNCNRGVTSTASDLEVEARNFFASNNVAIEITNSLKRSARVVGNFFTDTKFRAVDAHDNGGNFEEFTVEDNEIEVDFSPAPNFSAEFAVNLHEAVTINQVDASISNNQIELLGTRAGIDLTFNRTVDINGNHISITMFQGGSPFETHGIWLHDCGDINVIRDTVIGLSATSAGDIHAVEVETTDMANICSNVVDNTNVAFKFDGANPDMLFTRNSINTNDVGLWVSADNGDGFIGTQGVNNRAHDNSWEVGSTYFLSGARNSNLPFFINASRFHVRNLLQPQHPPSIDLPNAPLATWFDDLGTGFSFLCGGPIIETPEDTFSVLERSIADGTTPFTEYADAQFFRSETNFHRKLKNNPGLLGGNASIDAFYASMESGAVGTFYQVTQGIGQLGQPDAATEQNYTALENEIGTRMGQLSGIDAQLLTATGSARDALTGQRKALVLEIDSLYNEKQMLDDVILAQRIASADQLIALNNSAVTTSVPEQYQQTVNAVFLNSVAKGNLSLTQSERTQLTAIANSCLYEFGPAVSGARKLLAMTDGPQIYDDDLLCSPPSEYAAGVAGSNDTYNSDSFILYPNPAKKKVDVSFQSVKGSGELAIFDQQGALKYKVNLGENTDRYELPLSGYSPGFYFVRLNIDGQLLSKKLVVTE